MAKIFVEESTLSAIGNSIRAKTGKTNMIPPLNMPAEIASIQVGGGASPSAKWNDIAFIDYDGSVLYSYSLEEAQALTELPALPTHDGLVCQGWNWTLEAIKALNRPVTVGAMYITNDGATRLHIRIATVGRMTVPLYIGQTVANGVSIDWGDRSAIETLAGTGNVNTSHTYAEPGDYTISLMPEDGCTLSFGSGSSSCCVMGSNKNNDIVYRSMLQEVSIGKNVTSIGSYAFQRCHSLSRITIPGSVTSIGANAFERCYSLSRITIPGSVTSIGANAFQSCYSLSRIAIPDGVTSIGANAFESCNALVSIAIPDGVTSIGANAFDDCKSLVSIAIPDGVTSIGSYAFQLCYSLSHITIPGSVKSISSYAFQSCYSLSRIAIQDGVKYIDSVALANCYSLASIAIPDSVIYINSNAFANCYGMRYYDFSACTDIPSLIKTDAFNGIPSDCQMLIPAALFDAWSTETNWATYAKYMVAI